MAVGQLPDSDGSSKVINEPLSRSIGAYTAIAWPFKYDNPNLWVGWTGDKTNGGMIWSCGGYINSHSGADYYARDLYRKDGTANGRAIYAGLAGKVVRARMNSSGYGGEVVIHYPKQRLLIRYAHLSYIAVREGQYIRIRQYIGRVGNTPGGFTAHLHLVVYENVDTNYDGSPKYIPSLCNRDTWHACRIYFFC
ncbi:MAG: M23 family metallopeptidase [Patescibacteria group bacterium]